MKLRPMNYGDLEQVIQIQKQIQRREVGEPWKIMLSGHLDSVQRSAFVATDDDQVIGFILGEVKAGGFGAEYAGWIEVIGVRPDRMGGGVGKALAERLVQKFEEAGVDDVCTAVRWDSGDLLAFFKNLGFDRSPFINLSFKRGG